MYLCPRASCVMLNVQLNSAAGPLLLWNRWNSAAWSSSQNGFYNSSLNKTGTDQYTQHCALAQIAKFMGPTRGPPGSYRPQLAPMLAPRTLLTVRACTPVLLLISTDQNYSTAFDCRWIYFSSQILMRVYVRVCNKTISCTMNGVFPILHRRNLTHCSDIL